MKILILGGYGVFGGRLAELLGNCAKLDLLICGRSVARAASFCALFHGAARVQPLALDRTDIAMGLQAHRPELVIDASGPFQDYGEHPYRVIEACIAAGVNYLDFADAASFVFGVAQFDAAAKAAGVFVLSGVSSFPVLTAAVLREMAKTMEIVRVQGGIAPSPFAGVGLNVMRAVVGYAGSPVKLRRAGAQACGVGLAETLRYTVAVPGRLPLHNILFSLVDVPDLQVIPPAYRTMTDIWMGAGPVPEVLHQVLVLLAKARAALALPSLAPLSPLFYAVLNAMRFGEHRGGMFVQALGMVEGREVQRSWHLLAEGDDGPYIPSMAIEGIVRKLLGGESPAVGARSGLQALELSDYDSLFAGRRIHTGFRQEDANAPLYARLLGSAFDALPESIRALHGSSQARRWSGFAEVKRGSGLLAGIVAAVLGFPRSSPKVAISVDFVPVNRGERWTRDFDGRRFSSLQRIGTGRDERLLVEEFGPLRIAIALVLDGARLRLIPRRWSFLGIPLPRVLLPRGTSFEGEHEGRFCFDVEISTPLIGRVVAYRGSLESDELPHKISP